MRQKKWKEKLGGNPGLIIIGAFIVLSIILTADHLFNLPHLLSGTLPEQFDWGELIFDLTAIFCIGLISFILIRKSEAERREIEQVQRRERDKAQEYLDVAGVILVALNAEQKVTLMNRKGCEILGYNEEEIIGKNWFDHFLPEWDRERVKATFIRLTPGGHKAAEYFENHILTKSGEERIIAWHNTLLTDETGNITGTLSSGEDITERKKAEKALKESEDKYKSFVERANDGIAIIQDLELKYVNPALAKMMGYSVQEMTGTKAADYPQSDERPKLVDRYKKRMAGEDVPTIYETALLSKEGKKLNIEVNVGMISYMGEPASLVIYRDITERKKAEEALKESEDKFKTLSEESFDSMIIHDREVILETNRAFGEMWGYEPDEVRGSSVKKFITPESYEKVMENISSKNENPYQISAIKKDGTVFSIEIIGREITYRGKRVRIVTARDITERKKAEEALKEREERFRQLAENIDQVFWLTDWNAKRLLYVNPAYERLYGRSCQSAYDNRMSWQDVIHPEDRARVREAFARSANLSQYVEEEYRIVHDDGTERWVLDRSYPIRDRDGRIYRFASVAEDITERKKAEEKLRESEERYKALFERSLDCVYLHDFEGNFLDANPPSLNLLGFTRDEIKSLNFSSILSEDQIPLVLQAIEELKKKGFQEKVSEIRLKHKNGEYVDVDVKASIIYRDGKPYAVQGIARDITKRKKAEEALQEERNKLQAIIDSMEYGLTIQDRDYNIIFQNEALKGLFGNQLGEKCYQAYEFRDEICDGCPVRMAWADGKPHTAERKIVRQSGEIMFWENTASPIRDARGEIVACLEIARNITERKKAEEALRESQAKLQSIFSAAPAGIGMTINQTIGELNARLCEITGYSKEELSGKSISIVYPSDQDYLSARSEIYNQLREKGHSTIEASWKRKDGRSISVLLNCALLKPGDFSQGITFTVLDISERKKTEEALELSEERYRELFDNMGSGVAVYEAIDKGKDFMFKGFNRAGELIEKVDKKSLIGKTILEIFSDAENFPLLEVFERVGRTGKPERASTEVRKDQIIVGWRENYIYRLPTGEIVSIFEDITERKKAEELLRTSEAQLSNAMKIAKLGYWEYDVAKDLFTFDNHFYAIFRTTAEKVGGYTMSSARYSELFVHPDDRSLVGIEIQKALKTTDPHFSRQLEHRIIYADGETGYIAVRFFIVKDEKGHTIKTYGANQDITERKQAEEEIRTERDKLENVTKNIGVGLAIISKDYQTVWANDVLKQIFGEVEGKLCYSTYNGRTDICPGCGVREVFEQGKNESVHEQVGKDKDGNTIWSQIIATPLRDKEGNITAAMEVVVPITERKKVEEALKESEERYRKFFENAALGIYRTTPDGRILLANPALVQMLGYSSFEELASRNLEEEGFEPQYSRNKFKESLEKTSEVQALESAWLRRDGSTIFVRENARAVRKEDGSILYYEGMAEDITERKKAEEALRTSEEKYRAIVENATDQIFTLDRRCRFLAINKTAAEISRKSAGEMVGKSLLQIFPKETAAQFSKNIEEVFETGQSKFIEERMCLGGKEFYSSSTLNPIKDDKGNVVAVTGIVRDITERKKAEEVIRASLDRYRSYIEATGQLGWTTSADGEVVEDIPSWRAYTGLSYEEIKGWGWSNALHPDDLEHTTQIWKKAVAARTLYEVEYRLRRHDGVYRHFMARGLPVLDEDGSIREWVGTCIDITERKKAGEALRESEQRYRGVVDNIGIGVSLISPNMEILFLNEQMKKWFPNVDVSKEVICYRVFNSPPKEEACSYCPTNKTLQDGRVHESITETPTGEKIINYRVVSSPIKDLQGKIIAAIEMVEDITEKKRLQEQLIQTEKLAAVGTLAYGIAHEFNNILAGMMANAELGLISKERGQIKECFEIIVDNSKRASSITNNLLAFARHKEARKELVDITEPLKSVLAITHRELEKHNIEVIEKFKPVPKIYCDPGQFSEVFLNMITNARDAMHPKGGRLTIQVESAGDCIRIIFKDTGCGIPEEIKGRIFEPFVTTKGALGRSEVPGTGLGLFLTYGIINGYKGKIEVETKVGKGTKFSIIIPISENQPRELLLDTRIESSKETEKKLKILLVDDEKAITLGLKKFLESKGHKVSTSLRAKQGLEIFRKGRFDLVLSDITIPDMDGIELIKKVKEKNQQAKIIVITGHIQKEKEEKARQAGADEVLIKPFKNDLLYQTISKIVI